MKLRTIVSETYDIYACIYPNSLIIIHVNLFVTLVLRRQYAGSPQ